MKRPMAGEVILVILILLIPVYLCGGCSGCFKKDIEGADTSDSQWGKEEDGLICGLTAYPQEIIMDTPFDLEVTIKNVSQEEILLLKRLFMIDPLFGRLIVYRKSGKKVEIYSVDKRNVSPPSVSRNDFIVLRSGDIYRFIHRTVFKKNEPTDFEPCVGVVYGLEAGVYKIQYQYIPWFDKIVSNYDFAAGKPWKGKLFSGKVTVTLKER